MARFTVCSQRLDLKFKLQTSNKIYKAKQSEYLFLHSSTTELLLLQGSSITDFRQEVFFPTQGWSVFLHKGEICDF